MRSDDERLLDMVESCDTILLWMQEINSVSALLKDRRDQSALLHELMKIGEAAAHVSRTVRDENPSISWEGIKNFRNIIVHEYFGVDWDIIWQVLTVRIPPLREDIQRIIETRKQLDA